MSVRREWWQAVEVVHDVVYFAADAQARYEATGLKGWWMGYFASRSAALGTPSAALVTAVFHGFAPRLVERALPDAWDLADRQDVLDARLTLAVDLLTPVLTDADLALGAQLVAVVDGLDLAGRPLAAAHAAVPVPDDAVGRLWWAATVLREYRGDSHVAILTAAGLDGCSANVLAEADGRTRGDQRTVRGWTEDEWADGHENLRRRAWVDEWFVITDSGHAAREQIEAATDRVSSAQFDEEMTARTITTEARLVDLARRLADVRAVPFPNPTATRLP